MADISIRLLKRLLLPLDESLKRAQLHTPAPCLGREGRLYLLIRQAPCADGSLEAIEKTPVSGVQQVELLRFQEIGHED